MNVYDLAQGATCQAPSRVARPASSAGTEGGGDSRATRMSARARSGPYTCCVADRDSACQMPRPSSAKALHSAHGRLRAEKQTPMQRCQHAHTVDTAQLVA